MSTAPDGVGKTKSKSAYFDDKSTTGYGSEMVPKPYCIYSGQDDHEYARVRNERRSECAATEPFVLQTNCIHKNLVFHYSFEKTELR